MRLWRTPYRWMWSTAWRNIRFAYWDLANGVRNVIRWTPVIWFDADFDSGYLMEVMEYKFRRMHKRFETTRITTDWRRQSRQCLICAELLKRLQDDDYWKVASKQFGQNAIAAKHSQKVREHDQRLLGRMIGKYLTHWWD